GTWTKEIDKARVREVLAGKAPFDYSRLDKAAADGAGGHEATAPGDGTEPQDTAKVPAAREGQQGAATS
ncbi:hypothetical protein ACH4TU_25445, partial [Streptomyces physcomitrii]